MADERCKYAARGQVSQDLRSRPAEGRVVDIASLLHRLLEVTKDLAHSQFGVRQLDVGKVDHQQHVVPQTLWR